MYFQEKQSEQKPGLYHSNSPGTVVNKAGLSSFAPLFLQSPEHQKNSLPPGLSDTLETFRGFPQLLDTTPVVAKLFFATRYLLMRHRSVDVGNKVSVCG